MIKALIFDMDGVLIDSEPIHGSIVQNIFDKYGIQLTMQEHQTFIGGTSRAMWTTLIDNFDLSVSVEDLLNEDQQTYMEKLESMDTLELIDGAEEILQFAVETNIPLGLASSSTRANIDLVLSKTGLKDIFEITVSGEEVAASKPDPAIFLEVAEKLKQKPEDIIVIEDSENGVKGAKKAGMQCIGYRNEHSGNQNLTKADWILEDLSRALPIINKQLG